MPTNHEDKAAYRTEKDAQAAATVAKSRYEQPVRLAPYLCNECQLWHLATAHEEDD